MGYCYREGEGVTKDLVEAARWYRKAADQGHADAQFTLGHRYYKGEGVAKDLVEAARWYRKAGEQGHARAQFTLGYCYERGEGVAKDSAEAVRWYRRSAEQGSAAGQWFLATRLGSGEGIPKDQAQAYVWALLAAAQGDENASKMVERLEAVLSRPEIAAAQGLAREFVPKPERHEAADLRAPSTDTSTRAEKGESTLATGTGFFITESGYVVTCAHVVAAGTRIEVLTIQGTRAATLVKLDTVNDLAILKVEGKHSALPIVPSRGAKLGATVASVGFPNPGLQGFAPKLSKGEIASLSGAQDDPHYFQVSVPVQPGNSGGALIDDRGNVVGVVAARLSEKAARATAGLPAENVNYAIKSAYLLALLESIPGAAADLPPARTAPVKFEDAVAEAERAAVLVIVR